MEDKRFALLIDSDNISARYIGGILDEITKYGVITYKRIYGDWTNPQATKWKAELLANSIMPIQQFSYVTGKNATDASLIIDAMDILYTKSVDGFCIVSSDSDFTRLASRLRESGMTVIGMGEEKTPRSFRAACTIFTTLEILVDRDADEETVSEPKEQAAVAKKVSGVIVTSEENGKIKDDSNVLSKQMVDSTIMSIINENENNGKPTGLGEIGSRLLNKHPDFDVRNYGYSSLSKFLEEDLGFKLEKVNNTITVIKKEAGNSKDEVTEFIHQLVDKRGTKTVGISELSNQVRAKYPQFNLKDFGYSQFSKFVQSIESIEVYEDRFKRKRARRKSIL